VEIHCQLLFSVRQKMRIINLTVFVFLLTFVHPTTMVINQKYNCNKSYEVNRSIGQNYLIESSAKNGLFLCLSSCNLYPNCVTAVFQKNSFSVNTGICILYSKAFIDSEVVLSIGSDLYSKLGGNSATSSPTTTPNSTPNTIANSVNNSISNSTFSCGSSLCNGKCLGSYPYGCNLQFTTGYCQINGSGCSYSNISQPGDFCCYISVMSGQLLEGLKIIHICIHRIFIEFVYSCNKQ
jgi:hypothetical protein